MRLSAAYAYVFGEIHGRLRRAVEGVDAEGLVWRPDAEANSIAWLGWHLTRVQDSHVAEIADREQVWRQESWPQRFGLPADYDHTGYGHSTDEVSRIAPPDAQVILEYSAAVTAMIRTFVEALDDPQFDRVVDDSYDPPVTAGVRFMSVVGDSYQHVGQAAYVRGLWERSRQE